MEHPSTRLYRARKALGLCPVCGGQRESDNSICGRCLMYRRVNYRQNVEVQTPEQKFKRRLQKANNQTKRNEQRRKQGLCVRCGEPSPDHWECDACRAKRRKWVAEHERT